MTIIDFGHGSVLEEKINSPNMINLFLLLTSLIAIPILLGFDFLDTLNFSILLLANTLCGAYLYALLSKRLEFTQIELFGVGVALGTLSPAILNYCARLVRVSIESTVLIFPLFMILILFFETLECD